MRFYSREAELKVLSDAAKASETASQFTVLLGRRRIGKTTLMLKGAEGTRHVYLYISRKEQSVLCDELMNAVRASGIDIPGRMDTFGELLRALILHSAHEPLTVLIDEFQNLAYVDKSIFGDIQKEWDLLKGQAHINLVVSVSVRSLMARIFEDSKEPLFQRCTRKLEIGPFPVSVLKDILRDHSPGYTNRDLLTLYMLTGGVPQYVEALMDSGATDRDSMLRTALSPGSVFLREGDDLLNTEFGKDNRIYLSILQLIASGEDRRPRIENRLRVSTGEYLRRLEEEHGLIERSLPILTKDAGLGCWTVSDMYLSFYLRYVQPNRSFVEAGRTDMLERVVGNDLESYEGKVLERYLTRRIREEWTYTEVGRHWSRSGDLEIDVVVLDSLAGTARLIEVKRNPAKLDMAVLRKKTETLEPQLRGFDVEVMGMSVEDM